VHKDQLVQQAHKAQQAHKVFKATLVKQDLQVHKDLLVSLAQQEMLDQLDQQARSLQ